MARPNSIAGPFPKIALCAAVGILVCSGANALARAAVGFPGGLYLLGLAIVALPIVYRLTSRDASTGERFALVCLFGASLYAVKVVHDAPQFTFFDELIHAYNAQQIASHHELFSANPILEATPSYPGLGSATSALMTITGLPVYPAGVIVVGMARLVLVASLFLLFLRIGGSGRLAGLAVAIYATNFNFVFWGAQYAYESLALPLLALVVMVIAEREAARKVDLREWTILALISIPAVVVTHHLSSYALAGLLTALAVSYWYVRRSWKAPNPWPFAVFAALLAIAWIAVVASSTFGYLVPVLSDAIEAVKTTIAGESPPRGVFQGSGSTVPPTPLPARALALLALLGLALALPFGLREFWRRYRESPFAILFAFAALGFFGTLALRLTPPAWETGNRASEFLFIGLAFILASAGVAALRRWPDRRAARPLIGAGIALLLVGNAISGWPWDAQLAQPMRVAADGRVIDSPPLAMAKWARDEIPDGRFAASIGDAGLLLDPGDKFAIAGTSPDIEDVIDNESLEGWQLPLLRENQLRYLVADRREFNADTLRSYFFRRRGSSSAELEPKSVVSKFNEVPGAARIYTNGTITVFDLEAQP